MEPQRKTGRDIRRQNRSTLLSELFFNGPLSRLDLAERTGLSPATASNVTADLIEERIVVEAGRVDSDGGRPRVLLRVDPEYGHVVGVVISRTDIRVELYDLSMRQLAEVVARSAPGPLDPATVTGLVVQGVHEVIASAGLTPERVLGVGIGVPGVVEQGFTAVVHAQTIGWDGVPLGRMLQEAGLGLPVYMDNEAKTLGQAEMWFGAGRGARHAAIVLVGSGVGAAVVSGGSSYQGATSSAGEWGHTTIVYGGRLCPCGARGCLEAYIGAQGVVDRYRQARRGREVAGEDETAQFRTLLESAESSPVAAGVLDETADLLGAGIADLVNLFNPERVVIGGWAGLALGQHRLTRIQESVRRTALPHLYGQVQIQLCALGRGAVTLGAATLPVAALLHGNGGPVQQGRPERPIRPRSGDDRDPVEVA